MPEKNTLSIEKSLIQRNFPWFFSVVFRASRGKKLREKNHGTHNFNANNSAICSGQQVSNQKLQSYLLTFSGMFIIKFVGPVKFSVLVLMEFYCLF